MVSSGNFVRQSGDSSMCFTDFTFSFPVVSSSMRYLYEWTIQQKYKNIMSAARIANKTVTCKPTGLKSSMCSCNTGKTLEVRRSEARDGRDRSMTGADTERMFLSIALDRHRPQRLLPPFPKAVPPPPPPSKERMEVGALIELLSPQRVFALGNCLYKAPWNSANLEFEDSGKSLQCCSLVLYHCEWKF